MARRKGKAQRHRPFDRSMDALRKRRSTANRILTVLKAALNRAYNEGCTENIHAWQAVKSFRNVDAVKVRYLSDDETRRLVNACTPDLRAMVVAALLTGARYGELAALRVSEFNPDSGTLLIVESKSGRARHIALTDEGRAFFSSAVVGKLGNDLVFLKASGSPWRPVYQVRPMREACIPAEIEPAVGFHVLRHSYASRLAMNGVPMGVIAAQLGHADTRMTEKHYAHLSSSYVSDTIRASFPALGIVVPRNVRRATP